MSPFQKFFAVLSLLASFAVANSQAHAQASCADCTKLSAVQKTVDLKKSREQQLDQIQNAYDTLELVVKSNQDRKPGKDLVASSLALVIHLLKADNSEYAIEAYAPFYRAHKKEVDAGLSKLSKKDRAIFSESLKKFERENKEGNG